MLSIRRRGFETTRSPGTGEVAVSGRAASVFGTNPESGALVHGATFTVTGSGFGSKSGVTQVWDDCSGSNPLALWDVAKPDANSSALQMNYRTPAALGRGVALPHSNITQYLCGAHSPYTNANAGYNVYIAKNFTRPSFPFYSYWSWYGRIDPNWVFSGDNHKFYGYSTGNGSIYNLPNNWYLEFRGGGDFTGPTSSAQWHLVDDAGGTGTSAHAKYGDDQPHPINGWVKREVLVKWNSSSDGFIRGWANNSQMFNETGKTDGYSGTTRCEGIEGYSGNGNANNYRYIADPYYLRGSHIGRFVLTNHATYASATIVEVQSYTSWSDTSCTLKCNKGKLSSGTVHLHYRDEVNGHQYLGTRTVA